MSNFTPGPWKWIEWNGLRSGIEGNDGKPVIWIELYRNGDAIDGHEENLRLIAAAPDLLKAAMAFVAPFDGIEVVKGGDISKARAAIAKATGQ